MPEKVIAAVRTGPETTEFREFDMPDIPDDGALILWILQDSEATP